MLSEIVRSCKSGTEKTTEDTHLEIYFTGCGREGKGDWCLIDDDVTFLDLVGAIREGQGEKFSISLSLDCPFSG